MIRNVLYVVEKKIVPEEKVPFRNVAVVELCVGGGARNVTVSGSQNEYCAEG